MASAALTLATGCSTTAERQVETAAFEACRGKSGDTFSRCIKQERDAGRVAQDERNRDCLETIAKQEDRAAMIDGRRAPDPQSEPAGGC